MLSDKPLKLLAVPILDPSLHLFFSFFHRNFFVDLFFLFVFVPCALMRLVISILFRHVAYDQQPPAKRRRGLTGSIVSTAVSAALIGTAVGLTVYRL